jgi:hypothetical protein
LTCVREGAAGFYGKGVHLRFLDSFVAFSRPDNGTVLTGCGTRAPALEEGEHQRAGAGGHQHQAAHPVRAAQGKLLSEPASPGNAQHVGPLAQAA